MAGAPPTPTPSDPGAGAGEPSVDRARMEWTFLAFCAALVVGEILFAFVGVVPAVVLHAVVLLALLNRALVPRGGSIEATTALLALALVPLLRLASLGVPEPGEPVLAVAAIIWIPLLVTVYVGILPTLSPGAIPRTAEGGLWTTRAWRRHAAGAGSADDSGDGLSARVPTPDEEHLLLRRSRYARERPARERAAVILASAGALGVGRIARILGWDDAQVRRVVSEFNEEGESWGSDAPEAEVARILEIYRQAPDDGAVVISMSEVDLLPDGGSRFLLGAYDVQRDHLRAQLHGARDGRTTLDLMRAVRRDHPEGQRILWVQDSRSHHWTVEIRGWADANNVVLVPLPSASAALRPADLPLFPIVEMVFERAALSDWETLARMTADHVAARNSAVALGLASHPGGMPSASGRARRTFAERLSVLVGRRPWRDQLTVALLGILLAPVAYVAADPVRTSGVGPSLALAGALAIAAVGEEVIFRGALLRSLGVFLGTRAIPVSGLTFAALYLSAPVAYIVVIAAVAMAFSVIVVRSGSLLGVIVAHVVMNIGGFVLLPALFS